MIRPLAALLCLAGAALAHDGERHDPGEAGALDTVVEEAGIAVSDAPLADQFGNPVTFREALGSGPVIVSFTYTRCRSLCGLADMTLGGLLAMDDPPADLRIVTLTLDPARDTPADMRARARAFGDPPNWLRLTGAPADVIPLLSRNGMWDGGPIDEHRLVLIVGNGASLAATRIEGRAIEPDRLMRLARAYSG